MPIKAKIWWDDQAQAYVVSSGYNEKLVAALKNLIPSGMRSYDPSTKFWYLNEKYGEFIRDIASTAFGMHSVSFTSKQVAQQAQQSASQQAYNRPTTSYQGTTEGAIVEFFGLLSHSSAKRAYLQASQELHPDKPTGDASKMAKLNELWSRIEKEFYKK
jgi:hypothetical protein